MGSAVIISGLVTFIAAYHYIRIFNSWVDAYHYGPNSSAPNLTGVPFNDAYRYMDWLLTVPLLLIEILLVMKLSDEEDAPAIKAKISSAQVWTVISWCTYPVVYLFPMLNIGGSTAVIAVQLGYTVSDIISKCGVGILIYQISYAKSKRESLLA